MEILMGCEQGFLKQLLDTLPVGVLILEAPQGKIIMSNEEMDRIHQRKFPISSLTDEYMEWRLFSMDGRPYKLEDYPHNRSLHHEEVIKNEEARLMRNDEKIITISINSAPIYDSAGRMTHVVVESTDMTDRVRCEDALAGIYNVQ
jgi:PAS domain-containing protein